MEVDNEKVLRRNWTPDLYPRNGSFVPVAHCGPDKDIWRPCGFGRVWFLCVESTISLLAYTDVMRRTWWKVQQDKNRMQLVGKCLEVF
jgi:hypothetical protein